jgi:hypothetical protein
MRIYLSVITIFWQWFNLYYRHCEERSNLISLDTVYLSKIASFLAMTLLLYLKPL